MQDVTVKDLAAACGGAVLCGDENAPVEHISLDSRTMEGNDLFVPLIGEKVDAHRFISQAFANGAVATLTSEHGNEKDGEKSEVPADETGRIGYGGAWIGVKDTRLALQDIGRWYRKRLTLPLIGITGSVGKTTTKEMMAAALAGGLRVYKTRGSRNSQVGVPITISDIDRKDQIGVIELGMSEPGELIVIARMAQVDMAVITNIGVAHIEQLGSQENIFREKMTIQDGLKTGGILLLNGDDPWLRTAAARKDCRIVYYGTGENCDYRAEDIHTEKGYPVFTAVCRGRRVLVRLKVMGGHQILNAMAALAAADIYGVPLEAAAAGLGGYAGMKGRQQVHHADGITVIDDSYNANPVSMKGAVDILSSVEDVERRIAVLADMKELGEGSVRFHRRLGEYLAEKPVDVLVTYGTLAKEIKAGAVGRKGPERLTVRHYEESEKADMMKWLAEFLKPGDCVLFKGSNSMKLGEAADYVCQHHH